jgi:hypothetical protein
LSLVECVANSQVVSVRGKLRVVNEQRLRVVRYRRVRM